MEHERRKVFQPLAQRRQVDRKDIEAEEEIFSEGARIDRLLQLLVGGGDDPGIDLTHALGTDALQLTGFQRPQQLGLCLLAQVAYLVEEQRSTVGQLEPSQPAFRGSGKDPLSWPNISDSTRSRGIAAQFTVTNGRPRRRLAA